MEVSIPMLHQISHLCVKATQSNSAWTAQHYVLLSWCFGCFKYGRNLVEKSRGNSVHFCTFAAFIGQHLPSLLVAVMACRNINRNSNRNINRNVNRNVAAAAAAAAAAVVVACIATSCSCFERSVGMSV
jgi:hypothetical protein